MWTGRAKPPSGRAIRRWRGAARARDRPRSIWGINGINYRQTINDNMLVVIMIETPTGVANAYDIASVPGVDVVIIGNNDLSSFSGFPQTDDRYQALVNKVHDDVLRAGKIFGQANAHCTPRAIRSARTRSSSRMARRTMAGRRRDAADGGQIPSLHLPARKRQADAGAVADADADKYSRGGA